MQVKKRRGKTFLRRRGMRVRDWIWRLRCKINPRKVAKFNLPDGSVLHYPLKSDVARMLSWGHFELSEIAFTLDTLKPGDVFFDIGANGGIYTVMAAKKVGAKGQVYAFEPSPREIALLRRNVEANRLSNVTIMEKAVSETSGKSRLAIAGDGALNSLAETNHPSQVIEEWQEVATTSIDDFMRECHQDSVNFIKIDVEGAERLVFRGAQRLLSSNTAVTILFESAELNAVGFNYSVNDFLDELFRSGLFVYYLSASGTLHKAVLPDERFGREIYNFVASNRELDSL